MVRKGIAEGERVVVSGLQRVRPGAPVTAKPAAVGRGPSRSEQFGGSRAGERARRRSEALGQCQARCRGGRNRLLDRWCGRDFAVFHRSSDLCRGAVHRHHVGRGDFRFHAAAGAVPADLAPHGQRQLQLSRRQRRDVAGSVAAPIEQQVNGVEGMLYMSSTCTNDGSYNLTVTFKHGVNLNMAQVLVQNRVSLAVPLLPDVIKQTGVTVKKQSPDILVGFAINSHEWPLRPALSEQFRADADPGRAVAGARGSAT